MKALNYQRIKELYLSSRSDSTELFQFITQLEKSLERDEGFAYLESCVIDKRLAWWNREKENINHTGNPLKDAFELFYMKYLGLMLPEDGEIIESSEDRIVSRWWNRCPTLDACVKLECDTREICKKVFHEPVQSLISQIHPGLRFERNYQNIRPYESFCEEIILLQRDE